MNNVCAQDLSRMQNQRGSSILETALLISLISAIAFVAIKSTGEAVAVSFNKSAEFIQGCGGTENGDGGDSCQGRDETPVQPGL